MGNKVTGRNSGAIGDPSIIDGANSYSVGNNNIINSSVTDAFILGNTANVNSSGGVALGSNSVSATGSGVAGYSPLGTNNAAITATNSTTGAVAVGNAAKGVYRQITGLAAGTLDSDAVNVAQLKAAQIHYFSVSSTGGNNYNNDGAIKPDAIAIGKNSLSNGTAGIALGLNANVVSGNGVDSRGGIAIGEGSNSMAQNATAMGANAYAMSTNSIAMGANAVSGGDVTSFKSFANGTSQWTVFGQNTIAIGNQSNAAFSNAIAIGNKAHAEQGIALGNGATSLYNGIAIGDGAMSTDAQDRKSVV